MEKERKQLENIFIKLFSNDENFDIKISSGKEIVEKMALLLGEDNKFACENIVKFILTRVENNLSNIKTRARFCIVFIAVLNFCKSNNIVQNANLITMIAVLILEYAKGRNISLEQVSEDFIYFNKNNGPFLSPSKWSIEECEKFCIDYFLREFWILDIDNLFNPFTSAKSLSFNITVLENKSTLFMHLLLENGVIQ